MNPQTSKRAGEVIVNSLEVMTEFERKCIQILRHANDLFEKKDFSELPFCIKDLFSNQFSRYLISDLISIFASHHLRPIVRHHPSCLCVGSDENVFANILNFAFEDQEDEVKLLGSLLINSKQVESLSKKAKVVAFLIDEDLKKSCQKPKVTQIIYNNQLH